MNRKYGFGLDRNEDIKPEKMTEQKSSIVVSKNKAFRFYPVNSDDLYIKTHDYSKYYEMLNDYQVKAVLNIKKSAIIGGGFYIDAPIDDDGNEAKVNQEIIKFVDKNLSYLYTGNFISDCFKILDAMVFGMSITEQIWVEKDGKYLLDKLIQVPIDTIELNIDKKGNVISISQDNDKSIDVFKYNQKFLIYTWDKQDGNHYGRSDLRAAWIPYFSKREIIKYYNMFLERYGFPYILAKYSPSSNNNLDELSGMVDSLMAATGAVIPDDVEIDIKEIAQNGADAFEKAIDKYDKKISIALLMPDLMGFNDTKSGSYALGDRQFDLFINIISQRYRVEFEDFVTEYIIRPLVDFNFGKQEYYPCIRFKSLSEDSKIEKAKLYIDSLKTGVFKPSIEAINHLHDILDFPVGSGIEIIEQEKNESIDDSKKKSAEDDEPENEESGDEESEDEQDEYSAVKYVNFQDIKNFLDQKEDAAIGRISKLLLSSQEKIIDYVISNKIVSRDNISKVNNIKIDNIPNIKTQLDRLFLSVMNRGISDIKNEISNQSIKTFEFELEPEVDSFKSLSFGIIKDSGMSITDAKEFIKNLSLTKSFQIAGDLGQEISRKVRNEILSAIENGLTDEEVLMRIRNVFTPYVEGGVIPSDQLNPYRIENIVRTNTNTFYNLARMATINQSVKTGLVKYLEYSAILDYRTTQICRELDGTIINANDTAAISIIKPPRHYNCRSILVPVTKYREDEIIKGLQSGQLKNGLKKPNNFYNGF